MKTLKIGGVKIKNPLFLAPMLEITDLPYRLICRKAGAGVAYTEMINIPAITHKNAKTLQMLKTCKQDKPLGLQITANSITEFKSLIPYLKILKFNLIDLNCGCPSDKTMENQCGSALLENPKLLADAIKLLKKENYIVTAKIRLGMKENNVLKTAKIIQKAGADAITIHARLASQQYSSPAQWQWIKKAKSILSIPVIGNGDINSGEKAEQMLEIADGAMIGRAAIGNPLIFTQILNYFKTKKDIPASFRENLNSFKEYLTLSQKYKTQNLAKTKFIASNFIKGIAEASKLRNQLMQMKSIKEIQDFADEI